jgi:iron complex transport system substrate-binding protein
VRVISLLPAATDIVLALGAREMLVGVSHECDAPAARDLPRVTSTSIDSSAAARTVHENVQRLSATGEALFHLNEESIRSLHPDLLLTQQQCELCAVAEQDVRDLAAGLTPPARVVTLGGTTIDGVMADIERVGEALEAGEPEELLAGMRARLRSAHLRLSTARAPRPRVALIEWTDPLFVAGHWTPELIRRAGGEDVLGRAGEHSRQVTIQEIRDAAPQFVIVAPCGYSVQRAELAARELKSSDAFSWARDAEWWSMDGNRLISRPGPKIIDAALTMAAIFHPALFSPLSSDLAREITMGGGD